MIEVLVAVLLLSVIASTMLLFMTSQITDVTTSRESNRAILIAEEGMEAARTIRDLDWSALDTGTHGLIYQNDVWGFSGTSDTEDGYVRTLTVTETAPNERQVDVQVDWMGADERPQTFVLSSVLTNWRNLVIDLLIGDWSNPQTLGTIDLGPGVEGTAVGVKSKILYITGTASQESKDDFFIVDATDGMNPVMHGKLDSSDGLNDVEISGNYAYVAANPKWTDDEQLQVIDVSNPDAPFVAAAIPLNGNNSYNGRTISVVGTMAYVGTDSSTSEEFYAVDISDPLNPVVMGTYEVNANVNAIMVNGDYTYVATSRDDMEMLVLDVSDPANPSFVTSRDLVGPNDATDVYRNDQDERVYLGREYSKTAGEDELALYDASTASAPAFLTSYDFDFGVRALLAADELLFVATDQANLEFQIYDIQDPYDVFYYSGLNFPQVITDLTLEDNVVYSSVRSNDALRIITSQ